MAFEVTNNIDFYKAISYLEFEYGSLAKVPETNEQLIQIRKYNENKSRIKSNQVPIDIRSLDYALEDDVGKTLIYERTKKEFFKKVYQFFKAYSRKKKVTSVSEGLKAISRKEILNAYETGKSIIYDRKIYHFMRYERNSYNVKQWSRYIYHIFLNNREIKSDAYSLTDVAAKIYELIDINVSKSFLQSHFYDTDIAKFSFGTITREKVVN